ncbi:MAG: hypothetical protein ACW975_11620 [Candidatus Thorarchaeota archaeon]|jgi:hypothetical protein
MRDPKRGTLGRYRDVSELRIQYQCEYRFYLQQKRGDKSSDASREGSRLHREVGVNPKPVRSVNAAVMALLVMVTIAAALLWVLG